MKPLSEKIRQDAFRLMSGRKKSGIMQMADHTRDYFSQKLLQIEHRAERLSTLLSSATGDVPFYHDISGAGLSAFPVTNKNIIRNRKTEGFLNGDLDPGKFFKVTTSGSSGQPFTCYHDKLKQQSKLGDLLFYNGLAGYEIGMRHILIRATRKPAWKLWLQNEIWLDPTHLTDDFLERTRQLIRKGNVCIAIGYPSVMSRLAGYCQKKGDKPDEVPLLAYIATSELIHPSQRDLIREIFGCRVVSRYACEEFGVLGQSDEDCERFQLNTHSFIIELLKQDEDKPASAGELGRVVVTDLMNHAMPFIRYDTGDLAVSEEDSDPQFGVSSLRNLHGKQADLIYDVEGQPIAPLSILVAFKSFQDVQQFQFTQTASAQYTLRLTPKSATPPENVLPALRQILGESANIVTEFLDEIPALPSGKKPIVRNEMP